MALPGIAIGAGVNIGGGIFIGGDPPNLYTPLADSSTNNFTVTNNVSVTSAALNPF